ncbi:hypothetical protein A2U01_0118133, partial [Trifolium medium]|nr:hypothetical protein [Trifolium medium]
PLVSHVLNLLALLNEHLKLSNSQGYHCILQLIPQPTLETSAHVSLIYAIPEETEES